MSSLTLNFEYDIFISYRHNDNRSGWVTEFVKTLQEELAASIKEPVSVYFDNDPQDGLTETYDVDESLRKKLCCLVFIPIISQTYCDPKSFAWTHEFLPFKQQAKEDTFGLKVELQNGNVASRILPIRIHELDTEDRQQIETELGGSLRAIDFVFRSAGMARPLLANEVDPKSNLEHTYYRDQIIKVVRAIKELITSMNSGPKGPMPRSSSSKNGPPPALRKKIAKAGLIAIMLSVLAYSAFYFIEFGSAAPVADPEKSVAVLPFVDLSKEKDMEYLGDGVAEEIINVLAQVKNLKVIARSSSFQFKGRNEDLREIGKKLGVSSILEGSVRKFDDRVRVTAQLINVEDGSHYWSKNMDNKVDDLFEIYDAIAVEVAAALKTTLLEGVTSKQKFVWNEEAQRFYQQGRYFYDRVGLINGQKAIELLRRSVELDSNQAISHIYLGTSYMNALGDLANFTELDDSVSKATKLWQKHINRSLVLDPDLAEARSMKALQYHFRFQFNSGLQELKSALEFGFNNPMTLRTAARMYSAYQVPAEAIKYAQKAVELDPLQTRSLLFLGEVYFENYKYTEAIYTLEKAIKLDPSDQARGWLVRSFLKQNELTKAKQIILSFDDNIQKEFYNTLARIFLSGNKNVDDIENHNFSHYQLAILYCNSGKPGEALRHLEQAYTDRAFALIYLSTDRFLDPLRNEPRFISIQEKMNYPQFEHGRD